MAGGVRTINDKTFYWMGILFPFSLPIGKIILIRRNKIDG